MLHVFHIDAGRMLTFDIGYAAGTVANLQDALSQTVHAPSAEQILLISGGEVLDNPERRVSRYSAGTDSNPIFLVCRPTTGGDQLAQSAYGQSASPTPDLANTSELEYQIYQASQSQPALQTIQLCVQWARRLVQAADTNVDKCTQLVYDQHLLHQGWLAVIANLDDTVAAFRQRLTKFRDKIERFSSQRQRAVDLLTSFDADAQLLRRIPLLPCLLPAGESTTTNPTATSSSSAAANNMSLYDWISSKEPEHSLQELAREAKETLDRLLDARILENLKALEGATLDRAQDSSHKEIGGLGKRLALLDEHLQRLRKLQVEQRQYADSLRAQEQRALTVANDPSIISGLCSSHLSALKNMIDRQRTLADITRRFIEAKAELLRNIHIRLQWVKDTHQLIQTGDSKVMMNGERLHRLRRQLELLRQLHDAPFVYASAVTEVVRRKAFSREFIDWADRLTDKSKQVNSDENRLRNIFSEKFDRHFLRTLFPGLEDRMPEFAQDAPEPFDAGLPPIEVDHVRELRNTVPQLQHILCVQKPSIYDRLEERTRQFSTSSLRREASFFSQTPPKYAVGPTNVPISGSAPVIIHNRAVGCQSPSWFAGDEMEFSPTESAAGGFLATVPVPAAATVGKTSSDAEDTAPRTIIVSDSDSETAALNQEPVMISSSMGNGGANRSAPIKIPTSRVGECVATAPMMTASRGQYSEKTGSSGKFGTPDEQLCGTSLEEDGGFVQHPADTLRASSIPAVSPSKHDSAAARDLEEKAEQLVRALEREQTARRQLNERDVELDNYRTLLSSKVIPELAEFRQFFIEVKRMFEELTNSSGKCNAEWTEIIDRAARKLESNLQTDLEEARKAEDELRRTELDVTLDEVRRDLDEEKKRAREFQKKFENSDAFLKQKDEVIELLQQRLHEHESSFAKQLEEEKSDWMKRLLIEQELSTDTLRAQYDRELEIKEVELQQLKQDLSEKQLVLRDMKREQDRLVASMCERECDLVSTPPAAISHHEQRHDEYEEKLRQIKIDLERDYKDKLQMLTAGLEAKHAQQLDRVRKEKEVDLRMLKSQFEQEKSMIVCTAPELIESTSAANLEAWRSTENMADAIFQSMQASTTASTTVLFQHGEKEYDGAEDEQDEDEEEDVDETSIAKVDSDEASSKPISPEDANKQQQQAIVATKTKAVQTKADSTKISVLRIAKGDLVLLVFDPQFKTYVVFSVSPTLYILKDSCLQRMGCQTQLRTTTPNMLVPAPPGSPSAAASKTSATGGASASGGADGPKQRWILGKVIELDYCQIKKPTNRYRLPMNTRFFRVATEPVVLKTQHSTNRSDILDSLSTTRKMSASAGNPHHPDNLHLSSTKNESGDGPTSGDSKKLSPSHGTHSIHPPSPIITRRDRRLSLSERAAKNPVLIGTVKYFCRQKGHGFITPKDGGDDIWLHVSDIEGEYVPLEGDTISYQICQIPPKFEKVQAIHAVIRNLAPGVHERWAEAPVPHKHPHPEPNTPECRHPEDFHFPNSEAATEAEEKHKQEDS